MVRQGKAWGRLGQGNQASKARQGEGGNGAKGKAAGARVVGQGQGIRKAGKVKAAMALTNTVNVTNT